MYDKPLFIEVRGVVYAIEGILDQRIILWLPNKDQRHFARGRRFGRIDDIEPDLGQFLNVAL